MKRYVTVIRLPAFLNLPRVIHVHRIRETIMRLANIIFLIPMFWVIRRLPTRQGGFVVAHLHVLLAKCLPWKSNSFTCRSTLTLIWEPRPLYFSCFFPRHLHLVAKVVDELPWKLREVPRPSHPVEVWVEEMPFPVM